MADFFVFICPTNIVLDTDEVDIVKPAEDARSQGQTWQDRRPRLQIAVESFTDDDVALNSQIENTEELVKVMAISESINLVFDDKNHDTPRLALSKVQSNQIILKKEYFRQKTKCY